MSVAVTRKSSPPIQIRAAAGPDENYAGNAVVFRPEPGGAALSVQVETALLSERGVFAHLYARDARSLGEALIEWADAVEA